MEFLTRLTFLVLVAAAGTAVYIGGALKASSITAFVFLSLWLILPYPVMSLALVFLQRKGHATVHFCLAALVVSLAGVLYLADVTFWHRDAQGAIAVVMTPLLQGLLLALLLPAVFWFSRKRRS